MDESDELREELLACGVQTQAINVLVEMGFHDRLDKDNALLKSVLTEADNSKAQETLLDQLEQLIAVEKDIAHSRRLAKQQGIDIQAINFLARVIRQNPGDGGEKVINSVLGYAQACNVPLSGIEQIAQKHTSEPESVLPQIPFAVEDDNRRRTLLFRDIAIGLLFSIVLMALMV
jgi:hemoglobin-like flavoprotein